MSICGKVGHAFKIINANNRTRLEKCADCGFVVTFDVNKPQDEASYMAIHKRDYITPNETELWNMLYPDRKVNVSPERKAEMTRDMNEKLLKKRMPKVAEEYIRTWGWRDEEFNKMLKWHLGVQEALKPKSTSGIITR